MTRSGILVRNRGRDYLTIFRKDSIFPRKLRDFATQSYRNYTENPHSSNIVVLTNTVKANNSHIKKYISLQI